MSLLVTPLILKNTEGPFTATWDLTGLNIDRSTVNDSLLLPGEESSTSGIVNPASLVVENEAFVFRIDQPIKYVKTLTSLDDTISGDIDILYFFKQFRLSTNATFWSDWMTWDETELPDWTWLENFYIEFKYICLKYHEIENPRILSPGYIPKLTIESVTLEGEIELIRTTDLFKLSHIGESIILCPQDFWKVFSFSDYQIIAGGITTDKTLETKYRVSFNSKKTWTKWEPLNKDNIISLKADPLRFLNMEISFTRGGTDNTGDIEIYDVIFLGNFQNVTADYAKTNKMGLRSDCRTDYVEDCGPCSEAFPPQEWASDCCEPTWNPYAQHGALDLYNYLSNFASKTFGIIVKYIKTDVDNKGRDVILHEYQTLTYSEECDIKVLVPGNKLPDGTVVFNPFDLAMNDSFEIHIVKDEFKRVFGVDKRPDKGDRIFICDINRLFQIVHVQAVRDFMNASVYYKAMLKKAEDDKHIKPATETMAETIRNLMQNSSMESMFGAETKQQFNEIANKPQFEPMTHNVVGESKAETTDSRNQASSTEFITRNLNGNTRVVEGTIENAGNIIAKSWYDLSNVSNTEAGSVYSGGDDSIKRGDNRAFVFWFKFKSIDAGKLYTFFKNRTYVSGSPVGYALLYQDGRFDFEINQNVYEFNASSLVANTWYAMVINMDQRQAEIRWSIWKRKSESEPNSVTETYLDLVTSDFLAMTPVEWNAPISFEIGNGNMLFTNLRVWDGVIAETSFTKILNQYIIRESANLIIADNADKIMKLPRHKL